MKRRPSDLEERTFDVLIVGGGITGACLAFDAATRHMSVAVIEKGDFGAATSSASSKLLHGGIRYLQQFKFKKVRESAFERIHFLNLAPHLVRWVPFVVPAYKGFAQGRALLAAGMATYRMLCAGPNRNVSDPAMRVPPGRALSAAEVLAMVPGLSQQRLTGGRLYHELHMQNSERMTLAFVASAANRGAVVANYVRADGFLLEGDRVVGVRATDRIAGHEHEIRARMVLNAAGPWIRALNQRMSSKTVTPIITGFSKGAHIVTRPLTKDCAVALPTTHRSEAFISRGGRHIFVIPWRGRSLIGTSYGPYEGDLDHVAPNRDDIAQLIAEVNAALGERTLSQDDVAYSFAGLYPLLASEIDPRVYQGTGDYAVRDHERIDGISGLFSVFGAKFTTARLLAEHALDSVAPKLGDFGPCRTREVALDRVEREVTAASAVREEMACHLDDFVFRRTGLGTLGDPGLQVLADAADSMGDILGWDEATRQQEVESTRKRFVR